MKFPGESHQGPLPELTEKQHALARALQRDVASLATRIGERNLGKYGNLVAAAEFLEKSFSASGYKVERQAYRVEERECWNLIVEKRGTSHAQEIVVVGAHYDSVFTTVGANDNASGSAALLALARDFTGRETARTLRFVAFANEEPPYFQTEEMGSLVYARRCKKRNEQIVAMLALETIGYYSDAEKSQHYPLPLGLYYPSTGNFIGFVGNVASGPLVTDAVVSFRRHAKFPCEGAALPALLEGVGWSDHWSFWQVVYPGVMVTDTAPFRYPHYHTPRDTPDKLDYQRMARVVTGLKGVVAELVKPKERKKLPKKKKTGFQR